MTDVSSEGEAIAVAALTSAVEGGDEETARALLARHPDLAGISIRDVHLVRMAAYAGMEGLVEVLRPFGELLDGTHVEVIVRPTVFAAASGAHEHAAGLRPARQLRAAFGAPNQFQQLL